MMNVSFDDDNANPSNYQSMLGMLDKQQQLGRTCVIADTRHNARWANQSNVFLGRGDIAFKCEDKNIANELTKWAESRDNGNPRCADTTSWNHSSQMCSAELPNLITSTNA